MATYPRTHVTDETHETNVAPTAHGAAVLNEVRRGTTRKRAGSTRGQTHPRSVGSDRLRRSGEEDRTTTRRYDEEAARSTGVRSEPPTEDKGRAKDLRVGLPSFGTELLSRCEKLDQTFTKSDAATAWYYFSPLRGERGTAGRRFAQLAGEFEPWLLMRALIQWAEKPDAKGKPHHAHGFTRTIARTYLARYLEAEHEARVKSVATDRDVAKPDRSLHRLDVAAVLAQMRAG